MATNPLTSQISDILLVNDKVDGPISEAGDELTKGIRLFDRNKNVYCQFEKIELIESVFEPYPKGSLILRDIQDIVSYIKSNEIDTIIMFDVNGNRWCFYITSTSYINNAAAETEQTFVSINFTNYIYKLAEQSSFSQIEGPVPYSRPIHKNFRLVSAIYESVTTSVDSPFRNFSLDLNSPNRKEDFFPYFADKTENLSFYVGLNGVEDRTHYPIDNTIQYLSYLSSYSIPKAYNPDEPIEAKDLGFFTQNNIFVGEIIYDSNFPRFLFWTGWFETIIFKYFYQDLKKDKIAQAKRKVKEFNYAVYDSDNTYIQIEVDGEEAKFKKIYSLATSPADQFMSKKYFYVRKTPKFLNDVSGNTTFDGNTFAKLSFQFQDEGQKYDYQIVSSDGVVNKVPQGANELIYKNFWGFYDSMNPLDNVSNTTHIGRDFGYGGAYYDTNFMGDTGYMPYVDCAEMWKNQFDLTPVDPNLGEKINYDAGAVSGGPELNYLNRIALIRYNTFDKLKGVSKQLEHIRKIERQNFISYVLCCIKEAKEETFFAALLGRDQSGWDPYFKQKGVNGEPLKYRYAWAKLKLIDDPTAIKLNLKQTEPDWMYGNEYEIFSTPENRLWVLDVGDPLYDPVTRKPNGEWSGWPFQDLRFNFAINISERTNWYSATGLTYSGFPLFPFLGQGTTGDEGGYYSPGWHAQSVIDEGFQKIKYRPIGHPIIDLTAGTIRVEPKGITFPPLYSQDAADEKQLPVYPTGSCAFYEFKKLHIVKMYKIPVIKLLRDSNITDQALLRFYDGKFIYWFDAQNIMDGPCD
jgi:hypothetical protein